MLEALPAGAIRVDPELIVKLLNVSEAVEPLNAWAPPLKMTVPVLQLKVPLFWVQLPDTLSVPTLDALKVPPCKVKLLVLTLDPEVKVLASCTNPLFKVRL